MPALYPFVALSSAAACQTSTARRVLPVLLGAALGLCCAGCNGAPASRARIAAFVLHASGGHTTAPRPQVAGRPLDFALPHGRAGAPYIGALQPGAIAHDRRNI